MLDLLTGGNGALAMIGAVIVGFLAVIWRAFRSGGQVERGKAARQANKEWMDANDLIEEARNARRHAGRNVADGGLYDDDGYRRPGS